MQKYITLFFLCCFMLFHSQEKLKVNYEAISNSKITLDGDLNLSEEMKKQMLEKLEKVNKQPKKYVLYYYDGNAYFSKDISNKTEQREGYFKLKDKEGFYRLNDYKVEEFYGYYPNNDFDIEYKDETLTIENYLCKLAIIKIGNITSQVWYTEEIPVSAGPFIYNNLPGLVLKIERPNFLCYTTHVSNDFDEKEVKKMDTQLKIYQGEELKLKLKEGLEKMRNYNKELTEMNKKKIMEMYK